MSFVRAISSGINSGLEAVSSEWATVFEKGITEHIEVIRTLETQRSVLCRIGHAIISALLGNRKVLWLGNGGSAADSQHLAAELVGRFRRERRALKSIALTADASILTGVSNDFGFEYAFRRQIEALCEEGDVVVGLSTSGNSRNVCAAITAAREMGGYTVAFTGGSGGAIATLAHEVLRIASTETARIQEAHVLCGHILCDFVESNVCETHCQGTHG